MIYHIDYQSVDLCHFGALGPFVGLLLLWTRRVVKKVDGAVGNYSIYVSLEISWFFKCLFSPNSEHDRYMGLESWKGF